MEGGGREEVDIVEKVHPALKPGPHNTPWALNASSLLGIITSLLTFKFSSLILNLIVRGQGNGGKGGLGNWNWVLGGKGSPSPQNRPTQHSLGLLTFKFSSLILNIRGQENGGKGGGGGGNWGEGFTQLSKQSLKALIEYEQKVVEELVLQMHIKWLGGGGGR